MKLNKLVFYNFGIYYKHNELDFTLQKKNKSNHNIILIGGKNGAGKSTILEAIKLNLYGSLIMGVKTNTENYLNYIEDRVNYNVKNNINDEMYITINLNLRYNGDIQNFEIKRKWSLKNLKEKLIVHKNNKKLTAEKTNEFMNYIRKLYSPDLFNFFLFDGEKITETLYDEDFHTKLKNITYEIFNLSLFKTLNQDLDYIVSNKLDKSSLDEIEKEYISVKNEFNKIKNKIQQKRETLNQIESEIKNIKNRRQNLNHKFKLNGGLLAEEREKYLQKRSSLKEKKKNLKKEIDNLYDTILPFIPAKELFSSIIEQIEKEREYQTYNNFNKKINDEKTRKILKSKLLTNDNLSNSNVSNTNIVDTFIDTINNTLKPKFDMSSFSPLFKLSPAEEENLKRLIHKIQNLNLTEAKMNYKQINEINEKIAEINLALKENQENTDLKNILNDIKHCDEKIGELTTKKENIELELETLQDKINEIGNNKNKLYKKLISSTKKSNLPILCSKIEKVLDKFIEKQAKEKLKEIENKFLHIINQLFSEKDYINDININPKTYEIKLISKNNNQLNNLSSGEQELVILSLLWALLDSSKYKFPIIFDTLLGRIDSKHRKNIIKNLINKTDQQIIILSTDTEINNKYYNDIKPYLNKEYLLSKKNKMKHKTTVKQKEYFFEGDNYAKA